MAMGEMKNRRIVTVAEELSVRGQFVTASFVILDLENNKFTTDNNTPVTEDVEVYYFFPCSIYERSNSNCGGCSPNQLLSAFVKIAYLAQIFTFLLHFVCLNHNGKRLAAADEHSPFVLIRSCFPSELIFYTNC